MFPILISLGPIHVYAYGTMIAIGVILSLVLIERNITNSSVEPSGVGDFIVLSVFSGIIGARMLFVMVNWEQFRFDIMTVFFVWEGGLIFYGGFFTALCCIIVKSRRGAVPLRPLLDTIVPFVALTQGFGRIGCFLNGCCWGKETSMPFGVLFPHLSSPVHPVQLYESFWTLVLFFFLVYRSRHKKFDGEILGWYGVLYGVGRFIIQFFRGDQPAILFFLDRPQLVSVVMVIIGLSVLTRRKST